MKSAVIVFPGSNCDRDMAVGLEKATGHAARMVWHKETDLPDGLDVVALPGGFSFGDYLRCGAIAAQSPIVASIVKFAKRGGHVLGVCNGFQVLLEAGLLPGALMRNAGLRFVCRDVALEVSSGNSVFLNGYSKGQKLSLPVAHHDGCYLADDKTLNALEAEERIALRYAEPVNGSVRNIAGILSENGRVLGMMPHPERAVDAQTLGTDGLALFEGLSNALVAA